MCHQQAAILPRMFLFLLLSLPLFLHLGPPPNVPAPVPALVPAPGGPSGAVLGLALSLVLGYGADQGGSLRELYGKDPALAAHRTVGAVGCCAGIAQYDGGCRWGWGTAPVGCGYSRAKFFLRELFSTVYRISCRILPFVCRRSGLVTAFSTLKLLLQQRGRARLTAAVGAVTTSSDSPSCRRGCLVG